MSAWSDLASIGILKSFVLDTIQREQDDNRAAGRPCGDFDAYLVQQIDALRAVETIDQLISLDFVADHAHRALHR